MHFKIVPAIGPRYWVGIAIASICGANLGDATVDVLKLGDSARLAMLGLAFAVIVLANQWSSRGNEVLYWLAILVVRAAATSLADIGVDRAHASYITLSALLAAVLGVLVALRRAFTSDQTTPQVSYAGWQLLGRHACCRHVRHCHRRRHRSHDPSRHSRGTDLRHDHRRGGCPHSWRENTPRSVGWDCYLLGRHCRDPGLWHRPGRHHGFPIVAPCKHYGQRSGAGGYIDRMA
jgi:hypothetical protein